MSHVTDHELVLFHYGDGLAPARAAQIEDALVFDAELRLRLADLRESLAVVADAWPADATDDGLEARVWARLQPVLPARRASPSWRERLARLVEPLRPAQVAFASLPLAALGLGYLIGQREVAPAPTTNASLLADDAGSRVLASFLSAHLQGTERVLLVAANSPDDAEAARELAASLLESHRFYALAAERAGKPALAQFLRELEPVLIEVANEQGAIAPALGAEIRDRDLAFKTRAAAALARQDLAAAPQTL